MEKEYTLQDLFDLGLKLEVGDIFCTSTNDESIVTQGIIDKCNAREKYDSLIKIIKSKQLDEYLTKKEIAIEWDGKGFPPVGVECGVYGALGQYNEWHKCKVFAYEHGITFISNDKTWRGIVKGEFKFRKPETEAEREKRERIEAVYDLYCDWCYEYVTTPYTLSYYCGLKASKVWFAIAEKTGYRKEGK